VVGGAEGIDGGVGSERSRSRRRCSGKWRRWKGGEIPEAKNRGELI
jgi:hypothetical protein